MTAAADAPRTLVLGLDALDFRYLDRFAGSLPNLARLREAGAEAALESTFPPWTASAWPSMYTGTDPARHGVYDFFAYDYPDEGEVVSRNDVDAPALWNYLTDAGHRSVVMNVPVTHPAEAIDGVLFPGYLAAEDDPPHPPDAGERLEAALGEPYRIYSRHETADDPDEKLEGYLDLIDLRGRAAAEVLGEEDWQFGFVQVQKTDAVFHNCEDSEAFRRVYEAADELVGRVLDAVDDDVNVIVCSDHGMGRKGGYQIYLNEVLRDAGYLETVPESERPSLGEAKDRLRGEEPGDDAADPPTARAISTLAGQLSKVGLTPGRVYTAAEKVGVDGLLRSVTPDAVRDVAGEAVDWRNSAAYCESATRLGVRMNVEGRDPDGVVPREEYEQVRGEIMSLLSRLETPDGRRAFEAVLRREDVYDGPHADRAPDVLVVPTDFDHALSTKLYGRQFVPIDLHDHEPDGVFLAAGPDVDPDYAGGRLDLTDVAPIVMALCREPVPERMTGRVPDGLLAVDDRRADYRDVGYGTAGADGSAGDDDAVTERLEDLGYL